MVQRQNGFSGALNHGDCYRKTLPSLPPPVNTVGFKAWSKQNLFSTPLNTLVTVLMLVFIIWMLAPIVQWALIDADWVGAKRADCTSGGACCTFTKYALINLSMVFTQRQSNGALILPL